jgi:hypothetical protein
MTIVYSSAFDASVDTNLVSYGAPDWYTLYGSGTTQIKVIAADDNVQVTTTSTQYVHALVHSLIGSINDYEVTARVRRTTGLSTGLVVARCGALNSQTFYRMSADDNDDIHLERWVAAVPTTLKITAASISTNAIMTARLKVTTVGSTVVLDYSLDGVSDSFTDSNAARLLTGPPGAGWVRIVGAQSSVWLDDFSVDNLLTPPPTPDPNSGGFAAVRAYWKRRREYEAKMAELDRRRAKKQEISRLRRGD